MAVQTLASLLHLFAVAVFAFGSLIFFLGDLSLLTVYTQEVGWFLLGGTLLLLGGFYLLHRGRYLIVRMHAVVEERLLITTLEEYFLRKFPEKLTLCDVQVDRKQQLQIKVFSTAEFDEWDFMLKEAERELGVLLKERFGYTKAFYLQMRS